jgi:hypothetical protein
MNLCVATGNSGKLVSTADTRGVDCKATRGRPHCTQVGATSETEYPQSGQVVSDTCWLVL